MNKQKILGSLAVLAIAVLAAFNVNIGTGENILADVSLDNIEALAQESSIIPECVPSKGYCLKNGARVNNITIQ